MKRLKGIILLLLFTGFIVLIGGLIVKDVTSKKKESSNKGEAYINAIILDETKDFIIVEPSGKQDFFKKSSKIELSKNTVNSKGIPDSLKTGEKIRVVFNDASITSNSQTYRIDIVFAIYQLKDIK